MAISELFKRMAAGRQDERTPASTGLPCPILSIDDEPAKLWLLGATTPYTVVSKDWCQPRGGSEMYNES